MCDTKWQLISYFALYVCKSAFRLWPTWILRKAVRVLIYTVKGGPPSCPKCIVVTDVKPRWEKSCKGWILSYDEHCTHIHLLKLWSVIYTTWIDYTCWINVCPAAGNEFDSISLSVYKLWQKATI